MTKSKVKVITNKKKTVRINYSLKSERTTPNNSSNKVFLKPINVVVTSLMLLCNKHNYDKGK